VNSNKAKPTLLPNKPKEKTLLKREGGISLSKMWRVLISLFYIAYDDIFVCPNIIE
jgi:hypothetical protein